MLVVKDTSHLTLSLELMNHWAAHTSWVSFPRKKVEARILGSFIVGVCLKN